MKKTSLFLAALVLAAAATSPAQTDLIARVHFAGADQISADPNHFAFSNEFCSAEARTLESQSLDRLSRVPNEWFKSQFPVGGGDGAPQLRPLLDDLLKSEWIFEMRDTSNGFPECALAIRLSPERAQLWNKNLATSLQKWTGIDNRDRDLATVGYWLKRNDSLNGIAFSKSGDWFVIDCYQTESLLRGEIVQKVTANDGWLSVEANWPRLAAFFPSLKEFDFPKIQMQAVGRGGNLQLTGKLTLAQPLPPLEKWRVPAGTIHQPLVRFTAVRGVGPWLAKQGWMRPLEIQPQPDQFFVWALAQIPFQTYAAEPVPDAKAALAQLNQRLSTDADWQRYFLSPFTMTNENDEISWRGLPFIMPFVKAAREPAGDFLVGGFFPNLPKAPPPPPELFSPLNQPNLVYYHWENTAGRLKALPQLSQLLLVLTRHEQVDAESAAGKWLDRIELALGNAVTEVTQTAPNELAFKRTAGGGLTALELLAFVDWLEAPKFPALDLRLPPPRVRSGQKPFNLMSPQAAPAPPAK